MKNDDERALVREILTKQEHSESELHIHRSKKHVMVTWKPDVKYQEFENSTKL